MRGHSPGSAELQLGIFCFAELELGAPRKFQISEDQIFRKSDWNGQPENR